MTSDASRFKRAVAGVFGWAHKNKVKAVACASLAAGGGGLGLLYHDTITPDDSQRDRQFTTLSNDEQALQSAQRNLRAVTQFQDAQKTADGKLTTAFDTTELSKDSTRLYQEFLAARQTMTTDFMFARGVSLSDLKEIRRWLKRDVEGDAYETGFHGGPSVESIRACQNDVMSTPGFKRSDDDVRSMQDCVANVSSGEGLMLGLKLTLALGALGGAYVTARKWHGDVRTEDARKVAEQQALDAAAAARAAGVDVLPLVLDAPTKISAPLKFKLKPKGASFA